MVSHSIYGGELAPYNRENIFITLLSIMASCPRLNGDGGIMSNQDVYKYALESNILIHGDKNIIMQ